MIQLSNKPHYVNTLSHSKNTLNEVSKIMNYMNPVQQQNDECMAGLMGFHPLDDL